MLQKIEFIFSAYHLIGALGSALAFLITGSFCSPILTFVNLPSLIIIFGLTFFLLLATFKKDSIIFLKNSSFLLFAEPKEPNKRMVEIAECGIRYVIGAGILGFMIGVVQSILNIGSSEMGSSIALATISILYTSIVYLFFTFVRFNFSE